jgi:hypothetical protein
MPKKISQPNMALVSATLQVMSWAQVMVWSPRAPKNVLLHAHLSDSAKNSV